MHAPRPPPYSGLDYRTEDIMNTSIPRRLLGHGRLEVSAIGLGCMGMSDFYGPADHDTNIAVLHRALDIGDLEVGVADADPRVDRPSQEGCRPGLVKRGCV